MRNTTTALMLCIAGALATPAAAQKRTSEAAMMRQMAAGDARSWEAGVVASLGVPAEERSPELLTAMIRALEHSIRWAGSGRGPTETAGHLAQALAATRDPRVLPVVAWYAYNGPPATVIMVDFGHQAVPHLLAVAMSPDAPGDHARAALHVLAGIVVRHGPGEYGPDLAAAAALHLDGPPEHYLSSWGNPISSILEAIALAGAIRAPRLLERLNVIANSTPAEIEELTGKSYLGKRAPACARAALDRTEPPTALCDPAWWATYPEGVRRRRR